MSNSGQANRKNRSNGLVVFGLLNHWDEEIPKLGIYLKMLDFLVYKNLAD
jgi:hypothetical protein